MDHIVYLDLKSKEMDKLATGQKTMIIRGASEKRFPYNKVRKGDELYFLYDDEDESKIKSKALVYSVFNSEILNEKESLELVNQKQTYLQLTPEQIKRWAGKKYLILIEITNFEFVDCISLDKSKYEIVNDWIPIDDIKNVKIKLLK